MKNRVFAILFSMMFTAAAVLVSGCDQAGTVVGQAPQIGAADNLITLQVSGGWPDVVFTHMAHAGYQNDECLTCHRHTGVSDTTIWSCSSCHSPGDTEGFCDNDAAGHGCWMIQCQKCHESLPLRSINPIPNPTPNCIDCHV